MAKSKVEISKVNVKIGEQTIELTLEQAQELRDILDETFGKKEVVVHPYSPIIIERPYWRYPYTYPHWTVTYGTGGTNGWTIGDNTTLNSSSVLGITLNQ